MMQKFFRATAEKPQADDNGRVIRYEFSSSAVARDNHTINTAGWDLVNYLRNPVFLWAHDSSALPIGRVVNIGVSGDRLMGDVEYAEADIYPFADTVYRMVKANLLNAVSVSWNPIEYRFSQDKGRAGGIDFLKQELLEVSQVPVPAMPSALVTARGLGIDTGPMHQWLERALDSGGFAMVRRRELEEIRRAARMPSAGKPRRGAAKKRGLYDVCQLAYLVAELGYLQSESAWEEEWEEDDSDVPAQLLAALKMLGETLVNMAAEEVGEMLSALGGAEEMMIVEAPETLVAAAASDGSRTLLRMEAALRKRGREARDPIKLIEGFIRAGKVLSAANEETLRAAHGQISDACDMIMGVCEAAASGPDDETERRLREAEALKRKYGLTNE